MPTVTLAKTEYQELKKKAENYDRILETVQADFLASPLIRDRGKIIEAFRKTKLYNRQFLGSLQRDLKRSDYFCW